MKNTHHRDLPSGQGRGYIEENLGVLNREEVPLLVARPPVPRPLPALPEVVRGQEEYREYVVQLLSTLLPSALVLSAPLG